MKRVSFGKIFFLSILVLAGLTSVASAANRAGSLTVSPMGGAYLFKQSEGFKDAGFVGLNLGYNFTKNWGTELVGTVADVEYEAPGTSDFRYWTARVDLLYHFRPDEKFVPYIAAGLGGAFLSLDGPGDSVNEDPLVNYGFGFKYFTSDLLAVRIDARQAWRHEMEYKPTDHGKNYSNLIFSGGLLFQFGGDDSGNSVEQADLDSDGVIDARDRCSGTPFGVAIDSDGCALDTDNDGVVNDVDHCPGTMSGVGVDAQGCETVAGAVATAVMIEDADLDGVADINDICPDTPSELPVNDQGCAADTDGDGVFDVDDNCLDSKAGVSVDPAGCEIVPAPSEELKLNITFAANSFIVDSKFEPQMQKAADFIKVHPGKKVMVEGHTDNTGSASVNLRISQKRADTVRWILVRDYGVSQHRQTAKGFGEESPLANNATQKGRMANRRVVLRLVD